MRLDDNKTPSLVWVRRVKTKTRAQLSLRRPIVLRKIYRIAAEPNRRLYALYGCTR